MRGSVGFSRPSPVPKSEGPGAPSSRFDKITGTGATRQRALHRIASLLFTYVNTASRPGGRLAGIGTACIGYELFSRDAMH